AHGPLPIISDVFDNGFVDLPPCRAVAATLCTAPGRHKSNRHFGGCPVKSGETVCTTSRSGAQGRAHLCKNLCVRGACATVRRSGQESARGCAAAYTSRRVSTVTNV